MSRPREVGPAACVRARRGNVSNYLSKRLPRVEIKRKHASVHYFDGALRLGLLVMAAVAVFVLTPTRSEASFISVFNKIIQTVVSMGSEAQSISGNMGNQSTFNMNVIAPTSQIAHFNSILSQFRSYYGVAMQGVQAVKMKSGTLSQVQALEGVMYQASTLPLSGSAMHKMYASVYGGQPTSTQTHPQLAQHADMSDATAEEGLVLAANSDSAVAALLSQADSLQQQAASAPPGTADMIQGHAEVLQLQSYAAQHRLLASMLRQRATHVASKAGMIKVAAQTYAATTGQK
jgi:hypothetical protein